MQKTEVVAALGQRRLLLPAWVRAALGANDRLKLYLTVLQSAAAHATRPDVEVPDLSAEIAAAGLGGRWLGDIPLTARRDHDKLVIADLERLAKGLADDLVLMARPVIETSPGDEAGHARVRDWLQQLRTLPHDRLDDAQVEALTHGRRGASDSLHLLVMDLHRQINRIAADLAGEDIDGANVWDLDDADRPRVAAFMRGLHRTAPLKFDHPGLDTVATRDGERLLLQNDIGTNDAHVLVLQVTGRTITLTYSDLHRTRFEFFRSALEPLGARWSTSESRTDEGLNRGDAYLVGTARFEDADDAAVEAMLEGIGSRIVFLIDWNRARKRLQAFVDKAEAIRVLAEAARLDIGHCAWLQAGGERLVFAAMQAVGEGAFRIGDRLDDVIGAADARSFLLAVMRLSRDAQQHGQPAALVADETRMLLARHVRQRTSEFDLLAEHASYCQALAQAISDGLVHGAERSTTAATALAERSKAWERKADHLVTQARQNAERQARWRPVARLVEQSDDVADALEEASFIIDLIAERHLEGWNDAVRGVLERLAGTVLQATQDAVRALAIARTIDGDSETIDNDAFLDATWRVLRAERQCDELLREARRVILGSIRDAPSLMLANELAGTLELASDRLLASAYALRDLAFDKAGVRG
jgi:uncharacterized protein Yka (UPF0111/DUF47 family)